MLIHLRFCFYFLTGPWHLSALDLVSPALVAPTPISMCCRLRYRTLSRNSSPQEYDLTIVRRTRTRMDYLQKGYSHRFRQWPSKFGSYLLWHLGEHFHVVSSKDGNLAHKCTLNKRGTKNFMFVWHSFNMDIGCPSHLDLGCQRLGIERNEYSKTSLRPWLLREKNTLYP